MNCLFYISFFQKILIRLFLAVIIIHILKLQVLADKYDTLALFIGAPDYYYINNEYVEGNLELSEKLTTIEKALNKYHDKCIIMSGNREPKFRPTLNNIFDVLNDLKKKDEIEKFIFYFGAHGFSGNKLIIDSSKLNKPETMLSIDNVDKKEGLLSLLYSIGKKRAIIIEACELQKTSFHISKSNPKPVTVNAKKKTRNVQDNTDNTVLFMPKNLFHKSNFLDTIQKLYTNKRNVFYTPLSLLAALNNENKSNSEWEIVENTLNPEDEFCIIDKRSYLSIRLDKDIPNTLAIDVSYAESNNSTPLAQLTYSSNYKKNIKIYKYAKKSEKIKLALKCSKNINDQQLPVNITNALFGKTFYKTIQIKEGHFEECISMNDLKEIKCPCMAEVKIEDYKNKDFQLKKWINYQQKPKIDKSFFIMKREMTVDDFRPFYETLTEKEKISIGDLTKFNGNSPLTHVSWDLADKYAKWLSEKCNKNYSLPTEDQFIAASVCFTTPEKEIIYETSTNKNEPESRICDENVYDLLGNLSEWVKENKSKNNYNCLFGYDYQTSSKYIDGELTCRNADDQTGFRLVINH
ncbi:Sulphatase-modifying factor domain protein [Candidatus Magnetomorum sp. HK-1]|nr:Sulphatase-modifying factor domain protein [Candidatus Magnetomorum sp. HK-1]